jgi:RND family efflux transporter MFP subunit
MNPIGQFFRVFGRLSSRMKGAIILLAGVIGMVLLIVLRPRPAQQEPLRLPPLVATVAVDARHGTIQVRGNGTVRPRSEVVLASQVGGRVEWVSPALVSGGRFSDGDVLLRVEPADYDNAVEIASAEVAQRRVEVFQAEEEVTLAREEYQRLREREGIELAIDSTELGSLVFREPQLAAARASLRRALARLEDAKLSLSRTRLSAPFDGVVRSESVDIGQFVAPGQGIATIYTTDEVEIVVSLTGQEARLVDGLWDARAGQAETGIPATVSVTFGGQDYQWAGYVDRAEGALNAETRTVEIVVRVPDPFLTDPAGTRPPLLLGTYADVSIQGVALDHYIVLPQATYRDGDVVWTIESDSLLRIVPAEFIQEVDGQVYLAADLADGTRVVISPLAVVTDSMTIRVAEDPSS